MRRLALPWVALVSSLVLIPAAAQDIQPDPADVEAVRGLLRKASRAIVEEDAKTFVSCCDAYVDCFFYDGSLVKGSRRIERALDDYFAQRPEGAVVQLDVVPRSYRVLSPDIMMVDWPATIERPGGALKVNTLFTVRKAGGTWSITSFVESVPYGLPLTAKPADPIGR
jgi:uncharacterized protein (TIGR02246 family)